VFAHEIAHVANRDLWIMGLADVMARATALLSYAGQFLLIVNLPLLLFGAVTIPWIVPVVLIFAPTGMSLLQLALSRAREFDADRAAAELTGDPMGLAAALGRLERRPGRFWEEILLPGRRMPEPSVLRTHPRTEQRIERLEELARERRQRGRDGEGGRRDRRDGDGGADIPVRIVPVRHPPRLRWTGVWY
jgi:heat shock protein HtpX